MRVTVGVDLGKTRCQVRVHSDDGTEILRQGGGAPGLAAPGGVEAAVTAVLSTLASGPLPGPVHSLAVGAAGAETNRPAAARLAGALAARLPARVAVTSDSVTAHLGALAGRPGAVLVAGTGAVGLGLDAAGRLHRADGWGPWLGDEGSGGWIGREAVRAVLRTHEQRGPATSLTADVEQHLGDLAGMVGRVNADAHPARLLGRLAPAVVRHAEDGDGVARDIVQRAAAALADLTRAALAACGESVVAVLGGLRGAQLLMQVWETSLPEGTNVVPPLGDALAGALTLAVSEDLPHERHTVRAGGDRGAAAAAVPLHGADGRNVDRGGPAQPRVDVDTLATEQARPDLLDLDQRSTEELVGLLLESQAAAADVVVAAAGPALVAAVDLVAEAFAAGGRVIYVGAGTPGRLAAVDAAECPPTFGTPPTQVVAVLAGGSAAAVAAVEGAEDDAAAGSRDLEAQDVKPRDVVVGITASGRTDYVLAALDTARRHGARTVAVVNNPGSRARDHAEVTVEVPTGAEVLAGSTRLRAGTAQKIVLNTLSTSAMIRAGKSYGPWMVDMLASNEKLRRRARRILREATGADDGEALRALEASGWSTKVALVSLLAGLDASQAQARLEAAGGFVRAAVDQSDTLADGAVREAGS